CSPLITNVNSCPSGCICNGSRKPGGHVEANNNLPGQEVLLFASTWPPGFRLPLHMHPDGHEFTFVIEGEQSFEIDGVGTKIVKAGEIIYTPPNTPLFGRNA